VPSRFAQKPTTVVSCAVWDVNWVISSEPEKLVDGGQAAESVCVVDVVVVSVVEIARDGDIRVKTKARKVMIILARLLLYLECTLITEIAVALEVSSLPTVVGILALKHSTLMISTSSD
jgi:hypothetical protein